MKTMTLSSCNCSMNSLQCGDSETCCQNAKALAAVEVCDSCNGSSMAAHEAYVVPESNTLASRTIFRTAESNVSSSLARCPDPQGELAPYLRDIWTVRTASSSVFELTVPYIGSSEFNDMDFKRGTIQDGPVFACSRRNLVFNDEP